MRKCTRCGGRLKRVHRTFRDRFRYMAIYECRECAHKEFISRRYTYHFGPECRCPRCGTRRLNRLKERDRIDPLQGGLLNLMERIVGGKLFHCRYCRVQFYDRRLLASEVAVAGAPEAPAASSQVTTPPDTANSDK